MENSPTRKSTGVGVKPLEEKEELTSRSRYFQHASDLIMITMMLTHVGVFNGSISSASADTISSMQRC